MKQYKVLDKVIEQVQELKIKKNSSPFYHYKDSAYNEILSLLKESE